MSDQVRARAQHLLFKKLFSTPNSRSCTKKRPSPDTLSLRASLVLIAILLLLVGGLQADPSNGGLGSAMLTYDLATPSASLGSPMELGGYIVLEVLGGDIAPKGGSLVSLLQGYGIVCNLVNSSHLILAPELLDSVHAIIIDASMGSSNGEFVNEDLLIILAESDLPLVLVGRAAWILHRLRNTSPPSLTAPPTTILQPNPDLGGAVFLDYPRDLTLGSLITSESSTLLPVDAVQTENDRLVNLTHSESATSLPSLRYVSLPNDIFLFSAEDPSLLTSTGSDFLVNTIAYSTALRESNISSSVVSFQRVESTLAGGFSYSHNPTIESTYHAVHAIHNLESAADFDAWRTENEDLVLSILHQLYSDLGSESGFKPSDYGDISLTPSAQGLWVLCTMGLESEFGVSEIVSYLSNRQGADGGFNNDILTTFHTVEALEVSGGLDTIDLNLLELWLRACVVSGSDTSDTKQWGGVAAFPTDGIAHNSYASSYVQSLWLLGKAHSDPVKLTEWIQRTSIGDGSFRDTVDPDQQVTLGTASALTTMSILGTLDDGNKTDGIAWFSANQLESGSFGIGLASDDFAGKTRIASMVSTCLNRLSQASGTIASGIVSYCEEITTQSSFEPMELLPSLMWTFWLSEAAYLSHAADVDFGQIASYLTKFEGVGFAMYPGWGNLTKSTPPEYGYQQYYDKGVWANLFGLSTAALTRTEVTTSMTSNIVLYLALRQSTSGHYRPSTSGSAHMQYSIAAVEALYLLNELDTIWYRSSLETAILSLYTNGQWSNAGWNLEPFAGCQSAVDYLSTRAALRLDLVDETMAADIRDTILSRLQYDDLFSLSWDVSALALLVDSGFAADLRLVSHSSVLGSLETCFSDGWFNESVLWQPVYTARVLNLVSTLGLRPRMFSTTGDSIEVSVPDLASPDASLALGIDIASGSGGHRILVHAFGGWAEFTEVLPSDVLEIPVPSSEDALGSQKVSVMLWDYGNSRSYDMGEVDILASFDGQLDLHSPVVIAGETINAAVTWTLEGGGDAGLTDIAVRLENDTFSGQWTYHDESPFQLVVPTQGLAQGYYNLSVTLGRSHCTDLTLFDTVALTAPIQTFLESETALEGETGLELGFQWDLCFQSNGSSVSGQVVSIIIRDQTETQVFSESMVSADGSSTFRWIPDFRGIYSFELRFDGNGSLVSTRFDGSITVYDCSEFVWIDCDTKHQYVPFVLEGVLQTTSGQPLPWEQVHITIIAPDLSPVVDQFFSTNASGHLSFELTLLQRGYYSIDVHFGGHDLICPVNDSSQLLSWTSTTLGVGGITPEAVLGSQHTLWVQLLDSDGNPMEGVQVLVTVTYLPSMTILQQNHMTNSSGQISMLWTPADSGEYSIVADYSGGVGSGSARDEVLTTVRIPTNTEMAVSTCLEVGSPAWILVSTEDEQGQPIDVQIEFAFFGPSGVIVFQDTVATTNGLLNLSWIPTTRGIHNFSVTLLRQEWYEGSSSFHMQGIYESPVFQVEFLDDLVAPTLCTVRVSVLDLSGHPIEGAEINATLLIDGVLVQNSRIVTSSQGTALLDLSLVFPGSIHLTMTMLEQDWLLASQNETLSRVLGQSLLSISTPGQPIVQGTTLGITVSLRDWTDAPLVGASVTISVSWSNGSVLETVTVFTGASGTCSAGHEFRYVGDFWISAKYEGVGLNSSSSAARIQRVRVTPTLHLNHNPTSSVGEDTLFSVGMIDSYGNPISGRILVLTIKMGGSIVYEVSFYSSHGLLTLHWTPSYRGLVIVVLSHEGNEWYLSNSTSSSMSVMELVQGTLETDLEEVDLFSDVVITYTLSSSLAIEGIEITIQVLGMDLVPVWTASGLTNGEGVITVIYIAAHCHGILQVIGAPSEDQFMLGGDSQSSLRVWTYVHVDTEMRPYPPTTGTEITVLVDLQDDLGVPIDGLRIAISVYDIYGTRLFTQYRNTVSGAAALSFVPTQWGIYHVSVSSTGSETVRSFSEDPDEHMHTVYCPTNISLFVDSTEIEVGSTVMFSVRLTNVHGSPLAGMSVNLSMFGEEAFGPVTRTTDSAGLATWTTTLDNQGFWMLKAQFFGIGTYLPVVSTLDLHSCYGTSLLAARGSSAAVIAGVTPLNVSVLLVDSVGKPLEGRTIYWEAFNDEYGLMASGSFVQLGVAPEVVLIYLERGGNTTVVFTFLGSDHYHSSNSAVDLLVLGTSEVLYLGSVSFDRADDVPIELSVIDEVGLGLMIDTLPYSIVLRGSQGDVNLTGRVTTNEASLIISTLGLQVGDYSLEFAVADSTTRIGCSLMVEILVCSQTSVQIQQSSLSGLVGEAHTLTIELVDSMDETLDGLTLWVSLFHPDGREIYGSLGSSTPVILRGGVIEVSWTPTATGNYSLYVQFIGDDWLQDSDCSLLVFTRRVTAMDIRAPEAIDYTTSAQVSVILSSGINRLSGVEVSLCVNGSGKENLVAVTNSRGLASFVLPTLLAGEYRLLVLFNGTDVFAPSLEELPFIVRPNLIAFVTPESDLYVGVRGMLCVRIQGLGVHEFWNGTFVLTLFDGHGAILFNMSRSSGFPFEQQVEFISESSGEFILNVTISGLPMIDVYSGSFALSVGFPPIHMTLDVATTPVAAALPIVGLVGLILRKKFGVDLPTDWVAS